MGHREHRLRLSNLGKNYLELISFLQHGLVRSNNKESGGGVPNGCSSSSVSSLTDRGAELKTKKSELRLYCDMIMQQVHSIRSAAAHKADATPDTDTDVEVCWEIWDK